MDGGSPPLVDLLRSERRVGMEQESIIEFTFRQYRSRHSETETLKVKIIPCNRKE